MRPAGGSSIIKLSRSSNFLDTYAIGRSCKFGTHLEKGANPKTS
jgi:hypothetical protein